MVYDSGKYRITLKKVIRRIEDLDEPSKSEWISEILQKFGRNATARAYRDRYEQGRLTEEMDKSYVVEIPDYVANWLEYCKLTNVSIRGSLVMNELFLYNYARKSDVEKLKTYFTQNSNQLLFANAWVNGYTIKKEKHYYVAIPIENGWYRRLVVYSNGKVGLDDHNYMSLDKLKQHSRQAKYQLTEQMIKDSNLSWAWQFAKEIDF